MANNAVVRYNWHGRNYVGFRRYQAARRAFANQIIRRGVRRILRKRGRELARSLSKKARDRIVNRARENARNTYHRGNRRFYRIQGTAAGTTHTTCRMIVRRTPKEQRFLRKMFKTNPIKNKFVNRFGFAWMGARAGAKTIWYSVCHLKQNNIVKYMNYRIVSPTQNVGTQNDVIVETDAVGNSPDTFIYLGKCTFNYELYNPTNYIMTVYIYDLICKRDTPYGILYSDAENDINDAPEACMQKGAETRYQAANPIQWIVADPTKEVQPVGGDPNTYWNTIGMKPTDYHYFNTFWKVKGMKKIVLPPTSSHHHTVVFNPKKKITLASLHFPYPTRGLTGKNGLAGLTQATLFGFQGQVAVENDQSNDNTTSLSTLPGKLIVNCVKKVNVWNMPMTNQNIISENDLKTEWTAPKIFTDLIEQNAGAV